MRRWTRSRALPMASGRDPFDPERVMSDTDARAQKCRRRSSLSGVLGGSRRKDRFGESDVSNWQESCSAADEGRHRRGQRPERQGQGTQGGAGVSSPATISPSAWAMCGIAVEPANAPSLRAPSGAMSGAQRIANLIKGVTSGFGPQARDYRVGYGPRSRARTSPCRRLQHEVRYPIPPGIKDRNPKRPRS